MFNLLKRIFILPASMPTYRDLHGLGDTPKPVSHRAVSHRGWSW